MSLNGVGFMSCNITNNLLSFPAFSALFASSFCVGATNACIPGSLTIRSKRSLRSLGRAKARPLA